MLKSPILKSIFFGSLLCVGFVPLLMGCADEGSNVVVPDESVEMTDEEMEAYNQAATGE